ncbi:hypothetical protein MKY85_00265 [Paenibacillus sp. FSL R5-0749]|uniref:hypothetical protein n=1 Tax=Paenibacillus sp. FSL R5-0749 TaxID=2921657 RepID=UPI00315B039B
MKQLLKKSISLIMSLALVFTMIGGSVFAEPNIENNSNDPYNVQTVQNDESKVILKAEYEGDEAYLTLDKSTEDITLQTIEHADNSVVSFLRGLIDSNSKQQIVNNYSMEINKLVQIENEFLVTATLVNQATNEQIMIDDSRAEAQLPQVLGKLAQVLGKTLAEQLARIGAVTASGVIAAEIQSSLKNKAPEYYEAFIESTPFGRTVTIGNPISVATAKNRVGNGNDVWAKNQILAFNLAKEWGVPVGPQAHGDKELYLIHYFDHYHPKGTLVRAAEGNHGKSHIFFSF